MSAGLATGALTLITTDLWLLSAEYTGTQLALLGAVAILAVTIALVVGSDLWERPRRHAEREQAVVFNIATLVSVLIGVTVLYIALFLAALAGRSEEHTSELQSRGHLVCRLLLEKKKKYTATTVPDAAT